MIARRKTRQIELGGIKVGGGAPITVQSMTKTDTRDVQATLLEIWSLEAAGCDIVRCAVPVREAAEKLGEIKRQIRSHSSPTSTSTTSWPSSRSSRAWTGCG